MKKTDNTEPRLVKFLLVEDDDDHAEMILRTLMKQRINNKVDRVKDGVEAIDYLFKKGPYAKAPRPDVILLDIKLPKMDGHEVLAKIKQHEDLRTIPVVMLTTSRAESDRKKAYNGYVNSYLVKPFDFEQFRHMVEELHLYWGVWNEPAEDNGRNR